MVLGMVATMEVNVLMSKNAASASKVKHAMRRYNVVMQRVRWGELKLEHVKDEHNYADWLTKAVGKEKVERSKRFATNCDHQVG